MPCLAGETGVWCTVGIQRHAVCGPDQFLAEASCADSGGYPTSAQTCVVVGSGGETGGGGETETSGGETETGGEDDAGASWDPMSSITYNPDKDLRIIDSEFVDMLRRDPNLLYLDSTLTALDPASGYYVVASVGELGAGLGWQEGDLLLSVNEQDLQGFEAVLDAYIELETAQRFELELERQGRLVSMAYMIQ